MCAFYEHIGGDISVFVVDFLCSILEYKCQYLLVLSHVSKAMLSNKDMVPDVFLTV